MPSNPPFPAGTPVRPPMEPATGMRRIKLAPHQTVERVTAVDDLFVLAHLGVPRIDPQLWSLSIDGLVERPVNLTLDQLKARPKTAIESAHQCCGSPMEPKVPTRRVANLRWGGVDLAALLAEVGTAPDARYLWSYGLDGGTFAGIHCDWYLKDLPLTRLKAGDVLLAYELNGAPLPAEHGFPVRLVVPGYYGTNSVKWLGRLRLADRRAEGQFASVLYNDTLDPEDVAAGQPARRPVWAVAPESIIVAPAPDATLARGEAVEIWGWAWSFRGVTRLEVSTDGGATFRTATLEPRQAWSWQRFFLSWRPESSGEALLSARAFDSDGTAQPFDGARNAIHTVKVEVR